jgi:hypothetical protein
MTEYTGLFWKEDIWLPPNVSWSDLTDYGGTEQEINYRKFSGVTYPLTRTL